MAKERNGNNDHQSWHLDKRIPVALIITIVVQTAGIVWWAATLNARVDVLEAQITPVLDRMRGFEGRQVRNDVRLESVERQLREIGRKLDQVLDRMVERKGQ